MSHGNLTLEISGGIATITLNRPQVLNALNPATMRDLKRVLEEIAEGNDARVVLLTGAGEKAFAAGADIAGMVDVSPAQIFETALFGQTVLELIERLPQPVIAVVNGYALGGGCELAMACDLIVASENARFGQPEVSLGIIPGYGGTQRLPRLVGRNLAKELILTGDMITAQRAYEIGLVNRVVPAALLLGTAREIAGKILSKGPSAIRIAKFAMNRGLDLDLANGCALEASAFAAGFSTADRREGMVAFLEKRKPEFRGI